MNKVNRNRWECPVMTQIILQDDFTTATKVKDAPGEAFSVIFSTNSLILQSTPVQSWTMDEIRPLVWAKFFWIKLWQLKLLVSTFSLLFVTWLLRTYTFWRIPKPWCLKICLQPSWAQSYQCSTCNRSGFDCSVNRLLTRTRLAPPPRNWQTHLLQWCYEWVIARQK